MWPKLLFFLFFLLYNSQRLSFGLINPEKISQAIVHMSDILLSLSRNLWGFPTFFMAGIIFFWQSQIFHSFIPVPSLLNSKNTSEIEYLMIPGMKKVGTPHKFLLRVRRISDM